MHRFLCLNLQFCKAWFIQAHIIPPYKQPADEPANNTDDDDWSFFEDDEFGDEDNKPRK